MGYDDKRPAAYNIFPTLAELSFRHLECQIDHPPLSPHAPRTGEVKTPVWILRETVLTLHEQLLARFGGAAILFLN